MKHYGIDLAEGSVIKNATVDMGTTFPLTGNVGELFFRTDDNTLYVHGNTTWLPTHGSINTLTDVNLTSVSDGQVLAFNSTSGLWENITSSAGPIGLNDLTDVNFVGSPSPVSGNLLRFDGTNWTAINDGAGSGLDADTVDGAELTDLVQASDPPATGRNRIINGAFTVFQRGVSFTSAASGTFISDRWLLVNVSSAVVDTTRGTSSSLAYTSGDPVPPNDHCRVAVTTADTSIAAGDAVGYQQKIEGINLVDFNFGNATNPGYATISFWTAHNRTGTYCVGLRNTDNTRSYVFEYTQSVANTWEYHTHTFPIDTTGTWSDDAGSVGLNVFMTQASGTTFQTTPNVWTTGNYVATSNQVNGVGATSDRFRFTGVQLELGSQATPFEVLTKDIVFGQCMRYYEQSIAEGVDITISGLRTLIYATNLNTAKHTFSIYVPYRATKALSPTLTFYAATTNVVGKWSDVTAGVDITPAIWRNDSAAFVAFATQSTAATAYNMQFKWKAEAEL